MRPDPIAQLVLAELARRGWPIIELAERSGVNRCVLSRWLSGQRSVRLSDALSVMAELGLSVSKEDLGVTTHHPPPQARRPPRP